MREHSNIQPHKRNIANKANFVQAVYTLRFSQIFWQLNSGYFNVLNFILLVFNNINKLQARTISDKHQHMHFTFNNILV